MQNRSVMLAIASHTARCNPISDTRRAAPSPISSGFSTYRWNNSPSIRVARLLGSATAG